MEVYFGKVETPTSMWFLIIWVIVCVCLFLGVFQDAYVGYRSRYVLEFPLHLQKLNAQKETHKTPLLVVMLHGMYSVPQQWHSYYTDTHFDNVRIYAPHMRTPEDCDRAFDAVHKYAETNRDCRIVILSTSFGSIIGGTIHYNFIAKDKQWWEKRVFHISIAGAFYGSTWMDLLARWGFARHIYNPAFVLALRTGNARNESMWRSIPEKSTFCYYNSWDYKVVPYTSSIIHHMSPSKDVTFTGHSAIVEKVREDAVERAIRFFKEEDEESDDVDTEFLLME
jgi:hypothetical protein